MGSYCPHHPTPFPSEARLPVAFPQPLGIPKGDALTLLPTGRKKGEERLRWMQKNQTDFQPHGTFRRILGDDFNSVMQTFASLIRLIAASDCRPIGKKKRNFAVQTTNRETMKKSFLFWMLLAGIVMTGAASCSDDGKQDDVKKPDVVTPTDSTDTQKPDNPEQPEPSATQGWPANYGGVMLQAFYWDGYADAQWSQLERQVENLATTFNLVWIPQSGNCGGQSMGYDDLYWFTNYNRSFGTADELRSMIRTFKSHGIGTIADVVINHRRNLSSWTDFPAETYNGVTYQLTSNDICADDEAARSGYQVGPNKDTGEGWDGMRDLDHKSENVQTSVKAYLKMLLDDLGYAGFRYDMVKGYSGSFTRLYNNDARPQFSVGEYWDGSAPTVKSWINAAGKTSAAFDFPFRYTVRNALRGSSNDANGNNWKQGADYRLLSAASLMSDASYRQYAVTFVENHDTEYRSSSAQQDPIRKDTLAANAYLLAMPGTPCVFMKHWQAYRQQIANMVAVRKAVGIHNMSTPTTVASDKDYYVVQVSGTGARQLLCVVGTKAASYTPDAAWKRVLSGHHYAYYVQGIDPADIKLPQLKEEEQPTDGEYAGVPSFCTVTAGEICAFFEAPVSWGSQIFTWAWMKGGDGKDYVGTVWPGPEATLLGKADNGNRVYKWTSDKTTAPDNIIFSGGGQKTADLLFENGGYYTKDGLKGNVQNR